MWKITDRSDVEEQLAEVGHDTVHILVVLDETMSLAVRDLTNDIEGVKLQPLCKITALWVVDEQFLGLLQEQLGRVVDKRLVLNQSRHGKGRVDLSAKLGVKVIVGCAEQGWEVVALDNRLLNNVEVGLGSVSVSTIKHDRVRVMACTFINPLFSPYIVFSALGSAKERLLGPNRTTSPYFL